MKYHQLFGINFFIIEMMPCLYNYVTVDPAGFLGNQRYIEIMYEMCKKVRIFTSWFVMMVNYGRRIMLCSPCFVLTEDRPNAIRFSLDFTLIRFKYGSVRIR